MRKRPTLADVARAAGVSKTAASLALNGKGLNKVADTTRKRVIAVAEEMSYRPHGVARALVRRRADVLGVVSTVSPFADMAHHAFEHALLSAVFYHALHRGYNPMIYPAPDDGLAAPGRYGDGRSDAFILIYPPAESALLSYLRTLGLPAVAVCCRDSGPASCWVDSDNAGGIAAAVDHLARLGHRSIAYLTGPPGEEIARVREAAFRCALQQHGLETREEWIQQYTWNPAVTDRQIARMLTPRVRPTAILTWYDWAAEDVYRAVRKLGLSIPRDVSIVGFDDTASARALSPALTTVRQDAVAMGRAAIELAIAALCDGDAEERPTSVVCEVSLVVRQSTSAPPA